MRRNFRIDKLIKALLNIFYFSPYFTTFSVEKWIELNNPGKILRNSWVLEKK